MPRPAAELDELHRQLGDAIWETRLDAARRREVAVRRIQRATAEGIDFTSAVEQHAADVTPETVMRWIATWRREGLLGLVDRSKGPAQRGLLQAPQQLSFEYGFTAGSKPPAPPRPRKRGRLALPLVKWSGSKAMMASRLAALAPSRFGAYHEPFVGGGAMFFTLRPERAFLSDLNAELINLYVVVKHQVEALIAALALHQNTAEHFRTTRGIHPDTLPPVERAARTLFLNRTCFNGLYRVNRQGLFNVPYGSQQHTTFFHPETLRTTHAALANADVSCRDFGASTEHARAGDFVYLDPPYVSGLRGGQGFVRYQAGGFGEADERRVADLVKQLDRRGCLVMLSNPDSEAARRLYQGFRIAELTVQRQVGGHAGRRGRAREIVVRNFES